MKDETHQFVISVQVLTEEGRWVARINIDGMPRASAVSLKSAQDAVITASMMVPCVFMEKIARGVDVDPC